MSTRIALVSVRESLTVLAGPTNKAYLTPAKGREAYKLILQIKPNLPDWRTNNVALGMTIVQLGPYASSGRILELFRSGGSPAIYAGYAVKPVYLACADHSVRVIMPDYAGEYYRRTGKRGWTYANWEAAPYF